MSVLQYLRLVQIASVAIRQADPNAKVLLGSLSPEGMKGYLDELLKEGAAKWIDIVSLHPVEGALGPEVAFLYERVRDVVDRVRKCDPKLKVWVTSLAWPSSADAEGAGLAEADQADYMARGKVLCLAAGVERVIDHRLGIHTQRESSGTVYQIHPPKVIPSFGSQPPLPNWFLKPSFLSVKTANLALSGAHYRREVFLADRSPHYGRGYLLRTGSGEAVAVLWRRSGISSLSLAGLPQPKRAVDTYGNPLDLKDRRLQLSPSPSYLFFAAADAEAVAAGLSRAPVEYEDHPDSAWKQRLLGFLDRTPQSLKQHRYVVTGKAQDYALKGEYRPGIRLQATAAKLTGSEAFDIDLAGLKSDDLMIVRRVDLATPSQKAVVRIDGAEIARYDLAPLDKYLAYSKKSIVDIPLLIPNGKVRGKGKARVEFAGLDGTTITSVQTGFHAKKPGPLFLSDIDYVAAQQSQSILRQDENIVGRPIRMQNQQFAKGIGTHAKSQIVYFLGGQFRKFRAHAGLDQRMEEGSVTFLVLADGETIYTSKETVTPYSKTEPLVLDTTGCQVLQLRVENGDDGINGDWACWGDARVER